MALNGISTLTIPTGITATSYTQASSYLVAVGTFNYDAYGAGFAIRKDGGAIDAYMAQVIALGAGARNWTFVPGNGQPSFTRSMTQPDGTNASNDPGETGVAIWNVTTAAGNLSGSGADQINIALIPNGTSFTIYATELGGGGGADKEARQIAKLNLAANNRSASSNPRASYIITQLPTQYDGYTVVDNPNDTLTLTPGAITAGIKKVTYTGYHDDDVAFTDTAAVTSTTTATNFNIASIAENTTVLYTGYLLGTYTGNWTFTLTSDDGAYLWIGANAVSGYTTGNANAVSTYNTTGTVTVAITAGVYYPIRLLYGNSPSGGFLNLTYAHTGQSATSDFTGKLFSPGVSLVQGRPWTGIGTDDPANAAEPEATAWVLMDGPYGDEYGFYAGQSWRKMAPGAIVNGKTSYNYVDETVYWDGTNWLYTNVGLGVVSTGTGGNRPWQAAWTGLYKGTKITSTYVKTTNYPSVP